MKNIFNSRSILQGCGKTTVNGVEIKVPEGASISIVNGVVHVDGKKYEDENLIGKKAVNIIINGNVGNVDAGGSITCGNVTGNVDAGGNVCCSNVEGYVDAGGNVSCGDVRGNVDAGGNIRMNKG